MGIPHQLEVVQATSAASPFSAAPTAPGAVNSTPTSDDAVRALIALGYAQVDADRAVRTAREAGAAGDVSVLVRAALAHLTR